MEIAMRCTNVYRLILIVSFFIPLPHCWAQKTLKLPELLNAVALPEYLYIQTPELNMELRIEWPKENGLNLNAPSQLMVFEKTNAFWDDVLRLDLRPLLNKNEKVTILKVRSRLRTNFAPVAFDIVLYHCSKGVLPTCGVTSFRGRVKREVSENKPKVLSVFIKVPEK